MKARVDFKGAHVKVAGMSADRVEGDLDFERGVVWDPKPIPDILPRTGWRLGIHLASGRVIQVPDETAEVSPFAPREAAVKKEPLPKARRCRECGKPTSSPDNKRCGVCEAAIAQRAAVAAQKKARAL